MGLIHLKAIWALWTRDMKTFVRTRSRVLGTLMIPLLFLVFLGAGFRGMSLPGLPSDIDYTTYLVPGIIGMGMLFTSTFAGMAVIWDREIGFLKEIMVAPVNRFSIVIGRTWGGTTTATIQGMVILLLAIAMGFRIDHWYSPFLAVVFMMLIAFSFIGVGLILASQMKDSHGFGLIMNFLIFPLFFLSGAIYPLNNLPYGLEWISLIDPLRYGVDGLRGALLGPDAAIFPMWLNFLIMLAISFILMAVGAYAFEKSKYL